MPNMKSGNGHSAIHGPMVPPLLPLVGPKTQMAQTPADFSGLTSADLISISGPLHKALTLVPYAPPASDPISIKSLLISLLPSSSSADPCQAASDLCLCCAAISSSEGEDSPRVFWITEELRGAARTVVAGLAALLGVGQREVVEKVMEETVPLLKKVIRDSCADVYAEEIGNSDTKPPTAHAVVATLQFRWLVVQALDLAFTQQVHHPHLAKLCPLVIPCALTSLDHWSPEVKDQGMLSFIHIAKNATSTELCWFEDPILDACCSNIASRDDLCHRVMEMTVIMLTTIFGGDPRNQWYEKIFTEMLSHLEREPSNKERRISWLICIDPVLNELGLFLLAHFKRIFLLFFQWLHADDDKTILLVLERIEMIIKLTWIRKSPHFDRLVDELALVYQKASTRKSCKEIQTGITNIFILLKKCKGAQFEVAWDKHKMDSNLTELALSIKRE